MKSIIIVLLVLCFGNSVAREVVASSNDDVQETRNGTYYFPWDAQDGDCVVYFYWHSPGNGTIDPVNCDRVPIRLVITKLDRLIKDNGLSDAMRNMRFLRYFVKSKTVDSVDVIKRSNTSKEWPSDVVSDSKNIRGFSKNDYVLRLLVDISFFDPLVVYFEENYNVEIAVGTYPVMYVERLFLIDAKEVVERGYLSEDVVNKKHYPSSFDVHFSSILPKSMGSD